MANAAIYGKTFTSQRIPTFGIRIVRMLRWLITALARLWGGLIFRRRLPEVGKTIQDLAYGEDEKHRLDVVVPSTAGSFPVLVYVHGGAWITGDKVNSARVTHSLAHGGALVFSVNYRWAPEATFSEQLQDIARATHWAQSHAREYGGDPERLFLAGDSAGAYLVCWLHMALRQPDLLSAAGLSLPVSPQVLRGSLLFYGVYDLPAVLRLGAFARTPIRSLLGAEPTSCPELVSLASPLRHVTRGVAPLFVCVGEKDFLYGQSVALLDALGRAGVEHRALLLDRFTYPDAGHSFINFGSRKASEAALDEASAFIAGFGAERFAQR